MALIVALGLPPLVAGFPSQPMESAGLRWLRALCDHPLRLGLTLLALGRGLGPGDRAQTREPPRIPGQGTP